MNATTAATVDGLRRWARGAYAEEAAVELVARSFAGRFCCIAYPWVRRCDRPGWFWLDGESLIHDTGMLSGGERRLLMLAGALVSGLTISDLAGLLAGLDRDNLALVLAAFAHAGGSHEHADYRRNPDGTVGIHQLGPIVAWPAPEPWPVAS